MHPASVLILPGWHKSGPQHWQSRWEAAHGYTRVQQHDWQRPMRGDWQIQLEEAVLLCPEPAVLVAHSLGVILVASRNDSRCPFELAAGLAQDWGSEFVDAGNAGHLNADAGLGDWPQGHALLQRLMAIEATQNTN